MAPRLVIAIIQRRDLDALCQALTTAQFPFTHVSSVGGFLQEANDTLLITVDEKMVDTLLEVIQQHCHARTRYLSPLSPLLESGELFPPTPVEVQIGGAHVFVLLAEVRPHLEPSGN